MLWQEAWSSQELRPAKHSGKRGGLVKRSGKKDGLPDVLARRGLAKRSSEKRAKRSGKKGDLARCSGRKTGGLAKSLARTVGKKGGLPNVLARKAI